MSRACRVCLAACLAVLSMASSPLMASPFVTYITGETPAAGQVVFRATFDPTVKDSARLSIAAIEGTPGLRLDNIDFVPNSGFTRVVATGQSPGNGSLTHYNVFTGANLPDFVPSTNGVSVPPPSGVSRPASIVPNAAGSHFYYVENQFGFDGGTHRMMRTPIAGGLAEVVFDGTGSGLEDFSGVEIVGSRMYFFAHDPAGAAGERQLYSVPLGAGGLAAGAPALEVGGLDRASAIAGAGPGISDGSDEIDYDPVTNRIYGTNIATGEVIGFEPGSGPFASPAGLPFFIDDALVTAAAAVDPEDGLGLLSGITTPVPFGAPSQIDGIRPDGEGNLVLIGHDGVLLSIDIAGVLADGADDGDITRLFYRDVPGAGTTLGFGRAGVMFDDHTLLAPSNVPEPSTLLLGFVLLGGIVVRVCWRRCL